jgi:hypothetical protein
VQAIVRSQPCIKPECSLPRALVEEVHASSRMTQPSRCGTSSGSKASRRGRRVACPSAERRRVGVLVLRVRWRLHHFKVKGFEDRVSAGKGYPGTGGAVPAWQIMAFASTRGVVSGYVFTGRAPSRELS